MAIIVVIGYRHALSPTLPYQTRDLRNVGESALSVVPIQPVAMKAGGLKSCAADGEDVDQPVVVVIEERYTGSHRFHDVAIVP
jgi:hypothetical protein